LFGDSIPKRLQPYQISRWVKNSIVQQKIFSGATSYHLSYYLQPHLTEAQYDSVIIHCGVNDFLKSNSMTIDTLLVYLQEMVSACKRSNVKNIFISSVNYTSLLRRGLISEINKALKSFCDNGQW